MRIAVRVAEGVGDLVGQLVSVLEPLGLVVDRLGVESGLVGEVRLPLFVFLDNFPEMRDLASSGLSYIFPILLMHNLQHGNLSQTR